MFGLLQRRTRDSEATALDNESVDTLSCRFDGSTQSYFEVWIVNLLLTVCTLGAFRPWANARRRQYFFSNTSVGRHRLGYWAVPAALMPWGLVHSALLWATLAAAVYQPVMALVPLAIALLSYPLYRHQSLKSSAAATSYRGRRFSYGGSVKDSYVRLIGWPLLTALLAFLPLGHSLRSSWSYRFEQLSYGVEPVEASFDVSRLWAAVGATALAALTVILGVLGVATGLVFALQGQDSALAYLQGFATLEWSALHFAIAPAVAWFMAWPFAIWKTRTELLVMAGVGLEAGIGFDSEMSLKRMSGLYLVNALAIMCSLGFAIPWASIRVARYRASVTTLLCYADFDQMAGDRAEGLRSLQQASAKVGVEEELSSALDQGELDLPKAA